MYMFREVKFAGFFQKESFTGETLAAVYTVTSKEKTQRSVEHWKPSHNASFNLYYVVSRPFSSTRRCFVPFAKRKRSLKVVYSTYLITFLSWFILVGLQLREPGNVTKFTARLMQSVHIYVVLLQLKLFWDASLSFEHSLVETCLWAPKKLQEQLCWLKMDAVYTTLRRNVASRSRWIPNMIILEWI